MPHIPYSLFRLAHARRSLLCAFEKEQWETVREVDRRLCAELESASVDPQRDTAALLREVRRILCVYRVLVKKSQLSLPQLTTSNQHQRQSEVQTQAGAQVQAKTQHRLRFPLESE